MERIIKMAYKDLDKKSITKPTEYRYLKMLRLILMFVNIWPSKEMGENYRKYMGIINFVNLAILSFSFAAMIPYVVNRLTTLTFFDLCHSYLTMLMTFLVMTRVAFTMPQSTKYRTLTASFFTKIHLFYFKDVSDYAMKIHRKVHLMSHFFTTFLAMQVVLGCSLFNLTPMWNNYSSGKFREKDLVNRTYEHSTYLEIPQVYTNFNAYVAYNIFCWMVTSLVSIMFCMLDLLFSLMIFNLWGHLKILLHDLDSFPLPKKEAVLSMTKMNTTMNAEMYSEEELIQVTRKLKECIDHHRLIKDFTNNMSDTFGMVLFLDYAFHQVSGCLLLMECSQMTIEALARYLPLTLILFQQLIRMSAIFELIGSTSEKLKDGVYGVPWQYMDTSNRKTVAIFLIMVQEPIHVKALGFVNVGVTTMAAIIRRSLSYFTFLRSK